jgi:hypothetical protein
MTLCVWKKCGENITHVLLRDVLYHGVQVFSLTKGRKTQQQNKDHAQSFCFLCVGAVLVTDY